MKNNNAQNINSFTDWHIEKRVHLLMDVINGVTTYKKAASTHNISHAHIMRWVNEFFEGENINFKYQMVVWKNKNHQYQGYNANAAHIGGKRKLRDSLGLTDYEIWPEFADEYIEQDEMSMNLKKVVKVNTNICTDDLGIVQANTKIYPLLNFDHDAVGTLILGNYNISLNNIKFKDLYNILLAGKAHTLIHKNKYAIKNVDNETYLYPRELEIILYLLIGCSSRKISTLLNISKRTVESIIHHAKTKTNANSTQDLLDIVWANGILFETV